MKLKLVIAETKDFSDEVLNEMNKHFEVTFRNVPKQELNSVFCEYDIFWFRLGYRIQNEVLLQSERKVKIIVCPATGLDHIDTELCNELGITIISLKGESEFLKEVRATAELTINLALSIIRKTHHAAQDTSLGNWRRDLFKGEELFGKKVAIIGYGRLGKITADIFSAFGAIPVIFDINGIIESTHEIASSIEEALKDAFLLSLHISYSPENYNFINAKHLSLLTDGAYFINTSRGSLVNESDLVQLMKSGKIAGIAVDVLNGEPEIETSELWRYAQTGANVLITPHIGGNTYESFLKTEMFVGKKLIKLCLNT